MIEMEIFYTDPVAAIIMARDFLVEMGIKATDYEKVFGEKPDNIIGEDGLIKLYPHKLVELLYSGYMGCSLYVLPNSYSIFSPQIGDLLLGSFSSGYLQYYLYVDKYYPKHGLQINKAKLSDFDVVKIIQRDGKPFFWPEG
ncbi:MAG TPA: hypothetical protein VFV38_32975 [Ktedonobacteraceae bacterium]|nr:hypothetical protein [Ktedonobacteraceae bacterium]